MQPPPQERSVTQVVNKGFGCVSIFILIGMAFVLGIYVGSNPRLLLSLLESASRAWHEGQNTSLQAGAVRPAEAHENEPATLPADVHPQTQRTRESELRNLPQTMKSSSGLAPQQLEVSEDLLILAKTDLPLSSLTFGGVRLSDPREKIRADRIKYTFPPRDDRKFEAVDTKDDIEYQIEGGKVARILLVNYKLFKELKVKTADDVLRIFGPADRVEHRNSGRLDYYFFRGNQMQLTFLPNMPDPIGDIMVTSHSGDFPDN